MVMHGVLLMQIYFHCVPFASNYHIILFYEIYYVICEMKGGEKLKSFLANFYD